MPTTNPVPSSDPSDLVFNAEKLDQVVNSTAPAFTDRTGAQRRTLQGLENEFPNAQANAAAAASGAAMATTQASIATTQATLATTAAGVATGAAAVAAAVAMYTTNRTAVRLATAAALAAHTYNNADGSITMSATGVLTIDGLSVALSDDIAIQFEAANPERNGIYRCTTAGASGVAAVLTRRDSEYTSAGLGGACVTVTSGAVYAGWTLKVQQAAADITLGTTPITFSRQAQAGAINSQAGVSGPHTNAGYDTLTSRGVGSFVATAAAGYKYLTQPLGRTVPNGGKVTVFYQADATASVTGPRVSLFRSGVGVVSNTAGLTMDGQLRSVLLTVSNALDATLLCFDSNGAASNYALRYVMVPGDLAELVPSVTPLISALMGALDLMAQPHKDMTLRATGLVTGPSVNTSMDALTVNGLGDLSFVEASGVASFARTAITTVATGNKTTLVYRVLPVGTTAPVTGSIRARLERLGLGDASISQTLIADGQLHTVSFTATQDANRIMWDSTAANLRVQFLLLPGSADDGTAQATGLQAALVTLSQVIQAPVGGEYWTDDDKLIFWPTPVAFVTGRDTTIYGRQITKRRQRQFALDVSIISGAAESQNEPGASRYLAPELRFKPETLAGASCSIEVRDPLLPAQIRRKAFTRYLASATQTGTVLFTMLGDSTAALALNALRNRVTASGAAFQGVGTLATGGINYEGRSGWTALNYLGRSRPAVANPFLRPLSVSVPAELAIISANPTICFADDVSFGTSARPSYAEDETRSSYSIFDWDYWRQNVSIGLAGTEKLRVCVQLGRNGTTSATFVTDNETAHVRIVESFRATFPNGTIFIASEAVGEGNDTANFLTTPSAYRDRTAPLIQMKLKNFSNREADRVWVVPAWAMQNAFAAHVLNAASSTDADTGTTTHTIQDVVHYSGQTAIQWAESMLGPLFYVHQTT